MSILLKIKKNLQMNYYQMSNRERNFRKRIISIIIFTIILIISFCISASVDTLCVTRKELISRLLSTVVFIGYFMTFITSLEFEN